MYLWVNIGYSEYPSQIISKFKAIETLSIQPINVKIINEMMGLVDNKLELVAAIAKLGYETRGHFFRTPTCFTIIRDLEIKSLKLGAILHLF